ncbi:MAG: PIG-L family deacetylase, partial [Chloroflexi bacterium]|nr:PIG-L family deacetylase [Chloroflexota bacterium]
MRNAPDLTYDLKRLGIAATVLHLGAHPDDEDTGLLVYVTRKLGGRAVYWSATRGEGGQNIVNSYRDEALGLFRTWEALAAREVDGAESLFGPFVDFGFSKNERDALANWGHDNVMREVVRAIRLVKPQVVVSRWAGSPEDGHGHHQAVGQAVMEAFDAAGDPNRYPELLSHGLGPWQPLKLYRSAAGLQHLMNAGQGGARASQHDPALERPDVLRINTGEFDPADGRTYQERAWQSINCHQTQGMGFSPSPGDFYYYFFLLKTLLPASPGNEGIFAGFDPTLTGLADIMDSTPASSECVLRSSSSGPDLRAGLGLVRERVDEAIHLYHPEDPLPAGKPLLEGLTILREQRDRLLQERAVPHGNSMAVRGAGDAVSKQHLIPDITPILDLKVREFERVIARCLGLRLQCLCTRRKLTPGESLWLSARLWNHRNIPIGGATFHVRAPGNWQVVPEEGLGNHDSRQDHLARYEVFAGDEANLSRPYWLEEPREHNMYRWPDAEVAQQPLSPAPLEVECRVVTGDRWFALRQPAVHIKAFPGGYRELAPAVVPPISLHPESPKRFLLSADVEQQLELRVVARCNDDEWPAEGHLELQVPEAWHTSPSTMNIRLAQGGGAQTCAFHVRIPPCTPEGHYRLMYRIRCRQRDYGVVLTPVRKAAPGLPATEDESTCINEDFILTPSTVTVHVMKAHCTAGQRYAYAEGVKDELVDTLASVGVGFQRLSDYDIAHSDLAQFNAVVVGPNAYVLRHSLRENAFRFLEYVNDGGTLIVQYQRYEYEQRGRAPHPIKYSRPHDRVTDETARVTMLRPESSLFRSPNPIGPDDFEGWVHDRGLYFAGHWDDAYMTYLSCSDPGEEPKKGGLLSCRYGRGNFLYVG